MAMSFPGNPSNLSLGLLVLAFVLVVCGTSVLWANRSNEINDYSTDTQHTRNQFDWDDVSFWLIWIFAAAGVLLGQPILSAIAAGITSRLAVYDQSNLLSWTFTNYCRVLNQSSSFSSGRQCSSGGILAYTGIFLAVGVAFGPYSLKGSDKAVQGLSVLSLVFTLIGTIILWTSNAASVPNAAYVETIDLTVYTVLATWWTLSGAFANEAGRVFVRVSAAFISGQAFFYDFHSLWDILGGDASAIIYAGSLFCWFATIVNLGVAALSFWSEKGKVSPLIGSSSA